MDDKELEARKLCSCYYRKVDCVECVTCLGKVRRNWKQCQEWRYWLKEFKKPLIKRIFNGIKECISGLFEDGLQPA